jgi:hypothetical protein
VNPQTGPEPVLVDRLLPAVYRCAAWMIRDRGLHQRADYDPDTDAICTGYALYLAAITVTNGWPTRALTDGAHAWLTAEVLGGVAVPHWSDRPGRTAEEAAAMLDRAAELAERAA